MVYYLHWKKQNNSVVVVHIETIELLSITVPTVIVGPAKLNSIVLHLADTDDL